ncbi:MAG: chromate transporter [Alphaproteobacteria bacterium]|jgi:chromate transporter|nr:chromate transporter [Alphaproteobacteria bacterium]MEA2994319.1 chromate transporter [Alphaproteobacteria bacterium]
MRENTLLALVTIIAPLSLAAIGGASSIYAPLQHQVVDVQQWLTAREFLDLFALARVTPGPGSMLATLIGWKIAGLSGALVATLALFVPPCLVCFFVARAWNRYRGTDWHTALENGLAPMGAGFVMAAVLALLKLADTGPLAWGLAAVVAGVLTWLPKLHPFIVLIAGAVVFLAAGAVTG